MRPESLTLHVLLRYDVVTGKLWWRRRGREWFQNKRAHATWNSRYADTEAFTAVRSNGYLVGNICDHHIRAHHVIWCMCYGYWPSEVDHINGSRTDNRLVNLRLVDRQTNSRNASRSKRNQSGIVGVRFDRRRQHWIAEITVDYAYRYIGSYADMNDAIIARKRAEAFYGFHPNHGKEQCSL